MEVYPAEKMLNIFLGVRRITRKWNENLTVEISDEELAIFWDVLTRMDARAKALTGNTDGGQLL